MLTALTATPAAATPASQSPSQTMACARDGERAAFDVRVFQSELMVGAITCKRSADYNRFATQFQPALVTHGQELRSYFRRVYGGDAERRLNRFVTSLANEAASRRIEMGSEYCSIISAMFEDALRRRPADLGHMAGAHPHAASHGVSTCAKAVKASVRTPATTGDDR